MYQILIVCTGNICRSPMAEGLLRYHLATDLKERIDVASAGTHAVHGNQAEPYAVEAIANMGIDIRNHRARQLTRTIANSADLILGMEKAHLSLIKRTLGWRQPKPRLLSEFDPQSNHRDIQDPYGRPLEAYEECLQTLRPCIKGLILWLGNTI